MVQKSFYWVKKYKKFQNLSVLLWEIHDSYQSDIFQKILHYLDQRTIFELKKIDQSATSQTRLAFITEIISLVALEDTVNTCDQLIEKNVLSSLRLNRLQKIVLIILGIFAIVGQTYLQTFGVSSQLLDFATVTAGIIAIILGFKLFLYLLTTTTLNQPKSPPRNDNNCIF